MWLSVEVLGEERAPVWRYRVHLNRRARLWMQRRAESMRKPLWAALRRYRVRLWVKKPSHPSPMHRFSLLYAKMARLRVVGKGGSGASGSSIRRAAQGQASAYILVPQSKHIGVVDEANVRARVCDGVCVEAWPRGSLQHGESVHKCKEDLRKPNPCTTAIFVRWVIRVATATSTNVFHAPHMFRHLLTCCRLWEASCRLWFDRKLRPLAPSVTMSKAHQNISVAFPGMRM